MRKILSYTTVVLLFTTTGCKKFLEKNPDNRASLNTPEQVSQLLGTAYPQANYMAFCESISDNVADKGTGVQDRTNIDPYFFQDVNYKDQDSPEYYWDGCYTAIAAANQALETIRNAPDSTLYTAQKGEALVCRAYAHFMLVTFFSKPYSSLSGSTSAKDLGIPYVTTPEKIVFQQYDRKTVDYVYKMIEQDLLQGLPLLDDTKYKVKSYHFNKAAANAFAARFYLFKQDYAKVITYANAVLNAGNVISMLRPWNTTYLDYTPADMFAIYQKATEPANLLLVETASNWGRNYYSVRYALNSSIRDEIFGRNPTGGEWAFDSKTFTTGTVNYLLPKINEYFVRNSVNANIGVPYVMVPIFTAEEVLFNRAEAYLFTRNLSKCLEDLNTYASTRIIDSKTKKYDPALHTITVAKLTSYYGNGLSDLDKALNCVIDFKRAEYVQEGMRWFDLLRYDIPVYHETTDGRSFTLESGAKQRVFQLPETVKLSGMPLNPR
ncbi:MULTISPECIES: RagB/SusD family nutrient uptake outer membrane protein [Niastella]|uniref:RagB/SusD family nutrient uptake outer membrane protein n=1 Tax=Niastella soli TaxID=2821487 RepID=A0ABS3YTK2_9BACT|nr:RagB/SusD family nutrient uptake outer membrane protein [Niastella soli]MBO9201218.1 RagB/SusD family nutrient uptake outer membrane protein [Niastella soli]